MRRHLMNERIHSIEELLIAGLEAWMYRKREDGMVPRVVRWLRKRGFIERVYEDPEVTVTETESSQGSAYQES